MIYFPLIPRLQAMFRSPTLSKLMVWHATDKSNTGIMNGIQDGRAWRHVDTTWPEFGSSPRNVRLGLSTDGVNPFGQQRTNHSTWPITLVLYNLPPFLAIRSCFILLSTIVPGIAHEHNTYIYMYIYIHTFTHTPIDGFVLN
jgi:hypothetical protein